MEPALRIHHSLREIPREAWNACFPGELEDYDYLLAAETAGIPNFSWRYVGAYEGEQLQAAIPAFLTSYAIETTMKAGLSKNILASLRRLLPGALTLKLACIGSPVTEAGQAGFHPLVADTQKPNLLASMLSTFEEHAVASGHRLLGVKDITATHLTAWNPALTRHGYRTIAGMPLANLSIDFATMDAYMARLSASTRKDMRRKLKTRDDLHIVTHRDITPLLPQMMALYRDTLTRAEMQMEELNETFFQMLLDQMGERAFCTFYYAGDELLAFNLLLRDGKTLLDKFFCMDARGRDHNLYFISWFTNIQYCIDHGLTHYQSGAAGYENKIRLGSTLMQTSMAFRHKNKMIQHALILAAPFLSDISSIIQEVA